MNSTIVNNINNCAMPDDTLICLGDWSFGGFEVSVNFGIELCVK